MDFLFELSKIHSTLPRDEVIGCLETENVSYSLVDSNEDVLVISVAENSDIIQLLANRLSLTNVIDEFLFSCSPELDVLTQSAQTHPLVHPGTLAVRHKNRSSAVSSASIVDQLADVYAKGRTVNLRHPDNEIRVVITNEKLYVGVKKTEINTNQFERRKAHYRPFFSPISLDPKIARALVNISGVKKNKTLLDPFCGTGGFLIEAGLVGIPVIGSDIEQKMIDGCSKTLDFYKVKNYKLFCCDIGEIKRHLSHVDAVVTDFPYGRATTTKGEDIIQLYERAFSQIHALLKKNGRAVVGLSNKTMIPLGEKYFSCKALYTFRIHRSLTRYFVVYQK